MHTELEAFFAEHGKPRHCCKRDVHDQLSPIADIAALAHQQIATYKAMLVKAEMAPHDHALDFKLEHMHQTLGAIEREASALVATGRLLAQSFAQLDRYMAEWQGDIQRMESLKAQSAPSVP